jgi:DNA-binding CsgD family transcriptional regulator
VTALEWPPSSAGGELLAELTALLAVEDPQPSELLQTAASRLAGLLDDSVLASVVSDDGRWLHPLGLADPDPGVAAVLEELTGSRMRTDQGFTKQVLATSAAVRLDQTSPEVLLAGRPELTAFIDRFGIRSLMITPMRARGRPLGHVAALRWRDGASPHTAEMERFVQLVADVLGLGLQTGVAQAVQPASGATLPEELSEREREILSLLALGHTNREIAERLVLSVRTVEWHRARIQWKLGVSGRAALAHLARASGLIS